MCISEMQPQQQQRQGEPKAVAAAAVTTITTAARVVSFMNKTSTSNMKCIRGRSEIKFQCERKNVQVKVAN